MGSNPQPARFYVFKHVILFFEISKTYIANVRVSGNPEL
jgi:hypothetical protein